MKANELMIGDWVSMDNIPTKVYTIWDKGSGVRNTDKNYEAEGVWQLMDIEPIPLTAEILEKNGWKRNGDYPEYNLPINGVVGWSMDTHMIRVRNNADFETNDIFVRCDYVHELQHALRLCGLNELADNFKV